MKTIFIILSVLLLISTGTVFSFAQQDIQSPLKQYKVGQPLTWVTCENGFQLIAKIETVSPACVQPSTFSKLILRHWGFDPFHLWYIIGLNDTYKVNQKIDFYIEYSNLFECCIIPNVSVMGDDGKPVWQTHFSPICHCTPFVEGRIISPKYVEHMWNVNELGFGVLSINKTGTYIISLADTINKTITIISASNNTSQIVQNKTLSGIVSIKDDRPPCNDACRSGDENVGYEVDVYSNDGTTIVGKTFSDPNHYYSINLPAGKYIIYTYPENIQTTNRVYIIAGHNTIFNISYHLG